MKMQFRKPGNVLLATISVAICCGVCRAEPPRSAQQQPSGGTYTDKAGAKHPWTINDAHTLLWDGQAYLPVGGSYCAASLTSSIPGAWDQDATALARLKASGIRDLIIVPDGSLADVSDVNLQRLLDFLDSNEFHYGISFGKGVPEPLQGTVVKPASYKGHADASLTATWQTPFADTGLTFLAEVSTNHYEVARFGTSSFADGSLTTSVEAPITAGKVVPYLYPHKSIPSGTPGSIPDIWSGYDGYRDRILSLFAKVKLGKGFRFFVDPLGDQLSLSDEIDYLVPDSRAFLLEWESYIRTTYPNTEDAFRAWGLEDAAVLTPAELARLKPLWSNDVDIFYFYDPARNKMMRLADALQTRWWADFINFRTRSLQYYMNGISDVLKRQVANVPVVYNWTMNHPLFINMSHSGFDGLGFSANRRGDRLAARIGLPAVSAADQAAHTMWCIETSAKPEYESATSIQAGDIPYSTSGSVNAEITDLRRLGVKGFFPGGFRTSQAHPGVDWFKNPASLAWLRDAGSSFQSDTRATDYLPLSLPFPIDDPGPAVIGPIGTTGVNWTPRFVSGEFVDWWPTLVGYTIHATAGHPAETALSCLTAGKEKKDIKFVAVAPKLISVRTVTGAPVPVKLFQSNKSLFSVTFPDKNPLIFTIGDQPAITPIDAADDAIKQLQGLAIYTRTVKSQASEAARVAISESSLEFAKSNYGLANSSARSGIDRLLMDTGAYIWIEGENYSSSTFDDAPKLNGASGNKYLRISNYNNPPREYAVHYPFNIVAPGKYNIWVSATPPASDISPFQWTMRDGQRRPPADPNPHGPLYANDKFGWILLGTATLESGANTIAFYVTGRAPATGRYSFGIDAVFITTSSDPPIGRTMPMPIDPDSFNKKPAKR